MKSLSVFSLKEYFFMLINQKEWRFFQNRLNGALILTTLLLAMLANSCGAHEGSDKAVDDQTLIDVAESSSKSGYPVVTEPKTEAKGQTVQTDKEKTEEIPFEPIDPLRNDLMKVDDVLGSPVILHDLKKTFFQGGKGKKKTTKKANEIDRTTYNFADCIKGTKPTTPFLETKQALKELFYATGQAAIQETRLVKSIEQVKEMFHLQVEGEMKAPKILDVRSEVESLNSFESSKDQLFFTFKVYVRNPALEMRNITLTKEAEALLKDHGYYAFKKKCGNKAVVGFVSGGILRGFMNITSESSSDLKKVGAMLEAKGQYKFLTGGIGLDLDKKSAKLLERVTMNFFVMAYGGLGISLPSNREELDKLIKNWPETVSQNARIIELTYKPYDEIVRGIVLDPNYQRVKENIVRAQKYIEQLKKMQNVLSDREKWTEGYTSAIQDNLEQMDDAIGKLEQAVVDCQKAVSRDECKASQIKKIYMKYDPEVEVKHASCPKNFKRIEGENKERCGTKRAHCLKYATGVVDSTKRMLHLGTFDYRQKSGSASLSVAEESQVRKNRETRTAGLDGSYFPKICRDNKGSQGVRVLSVNYQWSSCYSKTSSHGDCQLRMEVASYIPDSTWPPAEGRAQDLLYISSNGVPDFGSEPYICTSFEVTTNYCQVKASAEVKLSCSGKKECVKWAEVPKRCLYYEEEEGTCHVKVRDLISS